MIPKFMKKMLFKKIKREIKKLSKISKKEKAYRNKLEKTVFNIAEHIDIEIMDMKVNKHNVKTLTNKELEEIIEDSIKLLEESYNGKS